jgi:hypothetical protein
VGPDESAPSTPAPLTPEAAFVPARTLASDEAAAAGAEGGAGDAGVGGGGAQGAAAAAAAPMSKWLVGEVVSIEGPLVSIEGPDRAFNLLPGTRYWLVHAEPVPPPTSAAATSTAAPALTLTPAVTSASPPAPPS